MSHVVDPVFGCHLWSGKCDRDGYGYHGRSRAHIVAYVAAFGPVPEGFELDHRCRRRNCVNPMHLDPVTRGKNNALKSWRRRAKQDACPKGHAMGTNRMVTPEGGVLCRACRDEQPKGQRA